MNVAIVSTFAPERCGIAYYSQSLMAAMKQADRALRFFRIGVGASGLGSADATVQLNAASTLHAAMREAERAGCEVVLIQHEFGLFGGESGCFLTPAVRGCRLPIVSILHTILNRPSTVQLQNLRVLADVSAVVIAPSPFGRDLLVERYGVDPAKIEIVPHGCPDFTLRQTTPNTAWPGRTIVLTYGLLSPTKNVEHGIQAISQLVCDHPDLLYVIAGSTHPNLRHLEGERYRQSLEALCSKYGISDHVLFLDQEFDQADLEALIARADISLCAYSHQEQIVSGTLSAMMAPGGAVIATPFWHARDAAGDGAVVLVPFDAPEAIAAAIRRLVADLDFANGLRANAKRLSNDKVWTVTGRRVLDILAGVRATPVPAGQGHSEAFDPPEPNLHHIKVMTTSTGLLEHCRWSIPNFAEGYCTDDNARGLMLCCELAKHGCDPDLERLADTYLAFLIYAFNQGRRRFRNLLGFDGRWCDEIGSEECHARALRAFVHLVQSPLAEARQEVARELFDAGLETVRDFASIRAKAIALIGFSEALADGGPRQILPLARDVAAELSQAILSSSDEWPWPEDHLSWGNAKVAHSLIAFGDAAHQADIRDAGLRTLHWLMKIQTTDAGLFSPVPMPTGHYRPFLDGSFDQQPIEAWSTLAACRAAYRATGIVAWKRHARTAFDWFLGGNIHRMNMTDARSGACYDGLTANGVNRNQGAESALVWQLALCEARMLMD